MTPPEPDGPPKPPGACTDCAEVVSAILSSPAQGTPRGRRRFRRVESTHRYLTRSRARKGDEGQASLTHAHTRSSHAHDSNTTHQQDHDTDKILMTPTPNIGPARSATQPADTDHHPTGLPAPTHTAPGSVRTDRLDTLTKRQTPAREVGRAHDQLTPTSNSLPSLSSLPLAHTPDLTTRPGGSSRARGGEVDQVSKTHIHTSNSHSHDRNTTRRQGHDSDTSVLTPTPNKGPVVTNAHSDNTDQLSLGLTPPTHTSTTPGLAWTDRLDTLTKGQTPAREVGRAHDPLTPTSKNHFPPPPLPLAPTHDLTERLGVPGGRGVYGGEGVNIDSDRSGEGRWDTGDGGDGTDGKDGKNGGGGGGGGGIGVGSEFGGRDGNTNTCTTVMRIHDKAHRQVQTQALCGSRDRGAGDGGGAREEWGRAGRGMRSGGGTSKGVGEWEDETGSENGSKGGGREERGRGSERGWEACSDIDKGSEGMRDRVGETTRGDRGGGGNGEVGRGGGEGSLELALGGNRATSKSRRSIPHQLDQNTAGWGIGGSGKPGSIEANSQEISDTDTQPRSRQVHQTAELPAVEASDTYSAIAQGTARAAEGVPALGTSTSHRRSVVSQPSQSAMPTVHKSARVAFISPPSSTIVRPSNNSVTTTRPLSRQGHNSAELPTMEASDADSGIAHGTNQAVEEVPALGTRAEHRRRLDSQPSQLAEPKNLMSTRVAFISPPSSTIVKPAVVSGANSQPHGRRVHQPSDLLVAEVSDTNSVTAHGSTRPAEGDPSLGTSPRHRRRLDSHPSHLADPSMHVSARVAFISPPTLTMIPHINNSDTTTQPRSRQSPPHSCHGGVSQMEKQAPTLDSAFRSGGVDEHGGGVYKSTHLYNKSDTNVAGSGYGLDGRVALARFPNIQGSAPGSIYGDLVLDRIAAGSTVLPREADIFNSEENFRGDTVPNPGNKDHSPGTRDIIVPEYDRWANQAKPNTDLKVVDLNARLPSQEGTVPSTANNHFTLSQVLDLNPHTAIELIKCQTDNNIKPKILRGLDIEGVDFPT